MKLTKSEMTDTRKTATAAKVVPVYRDKPTDTCQRAWIESDNRRQAESEREPFLVEEIGSSVNVKERSASLECERLCESERKCERIFSIDLEPTELTPASGLSICRSSSSSSSDSTTSSNNDDSHSDAKLVDKLRKVNRRKRKQPKSRTARLLQLCQCCPWTVPWSLLVVSALQVSVAFDWELNFRQAG